jgi:3-oxoacyl-[acyl-carrier protein] reductase
LRRYQLTLHDAASTLAALKSMILDRINFDGRAVIVAGAGGGGIGSATCSALAEVGARVIAVDIKQQALDELATQLDAAGAQFDCYTVDICDTDQVDQLMAELDESCGLISNHLSTANDAVH